jgi:hypothetical protein
VETFVLRDEPSEDRSRLVAASGASPRSRDRPSSLEDEPHDESPAEAEAAVAEAKRSKLELDSLDVALEPAPQHPRGLSRKKSRFGPAVDSSAGTATSQTDDSAPGSLDAGVIEPRWSQERKDFDRALFDGSESDPRACDHVDPGSGHGKRARRAIAHRLDPGNGQSDGAVFHGLGVEAFGRELHRRPPLVPGEDAQSVRLRAAVRKERRRGGGGSTLADRAGVAAGSRAEGTVRGPDSCGIDVDELVEIRHTVGAARVDEAVPGSHG